MITAPQRYPLSELLSAVWCRCWTARNAPCAVAFGELALHPEDHAALLVAPLESKDVLFLSPEGPRFWGRLLREDAKIKPGWAELRGGGDSWRFRWDPRFRCGRCGKVLPNEEEHDPAYVVPFCAVCAPLERPGMYGEAAP